MKKENIWENVKNLNIDIPFKETIFKLIDENLERVEFVKDHIGLRDFLFIAEVDTNYYDDLFVFFNADVNKNSSLEENERRIMEKYESHPFDIITRLKLFFEKEDRMLAVGIGFSNTEPTDEEIEEIEKLYINKDIDSKLEKYRNLRVTRFPSWYSNNSRLPQEVGFLTIGEEYEIRTTKINHLMESINASLVEDDLVSFMNYSDQLIRLLK